jgi:hypothetical protein
MGHAGPNYYRHRMMELRGNEGSWGLDEVGAGAGRIN